MRFGMFFRFFSGVADFSQMPLGELDKSAEGFSRLRRQHRSVIFGGLFGGVVGFIFGIISAVTMITQPRGNNEGIGFVIFAVVVMMAFGILSGAGWVFTFLPANYFLSAAGARYMGMIGTKRVGVARFVSLIMGVLGVGACVGTIVCIVTGHF